MADHILTINTGSSSLKAALYGLDEGETRRLTAKAERIGLPESRLRIVGETGAILVDQTGGFSDHAAALDEVFAWLRQNGLDVGLAAVGHRVVHGGRAFREPRLLDDRVVREIELLVPIDPEHLPQALDAIKATVRAYPTLPQAACFDTAFHRRMPAVAQRYALPRSLADGGVIRYGFHGLSYEYIMTELERLDPGAARGRVIIAHLGNGASLAAVRGGVGVDTTMGFTPTGGLVMGTRSGDLDPGVLLYLLQSKGLSAEKINTLVNRQAGLLGVSGSSGDMQDLLAREASDPRAAEAVDLFCYQARKFLGALAAALGGVETLVFTAGIGEHAAPVRERICAGLEFLGVRLDAGRNAAHEPIISRDDSAVSVRVIPTDEELMIARHTRRLIRGGEEQGGNRV
ncbi:MAG TPA: acetate/propionate family kinase [Chloroflexota bacterium]|nr:acetate/propionate family kinase [Chloroflexota bacterium]